MKKQVYFIPGMCASAKIFERIELPKQIFETHVLEWALPKHKQEPLASYVYQFSKKVTQPNPIFIGVSFGGVIAQELASIFKNAIVIIISSIKHPNEMSLFFKFLKNTKSYRLLPISLLLFLEQKGFCYGSKTIQKKILLYRNYLPVRDKLYLQWAIHSFLNWNPNTITKTTHIHGNRDTILPIKRIQNKIVINKGTHAMILINSKAIQRELLHILA